MAAKLNPEPQGSETHRRDNVKFTTKYVQVAPVKCNLIRTTRCEVDNRPSVPRIISCKQNAAKLAQEIPAKSLARAGWKSMTPTQTKEPETATLSFDRTPRRPLILTGGKKKASASLLFVEAEGLPYKIADTAAKPDPKPWSTNWKHNNNDGCKATRRDFTKSYSAKQLGVINPDECFKNNPAMVTEYVEDIFDYLRSMEAKFPVRQDFLEGHETSPWMRASLIDWLVGAQQQLDLYLETLHLSVAIVDRYLQENKDVGHATLQLVGTASLLIACKYEEMYVPDFADFLRICDDSFTKTQILTMERNIMIQLDHSFGRPLSVHFLRRYDRIARAPSSQHFLGKFILELALIEHDMSHFNPSLQAAAACCLSIGIMNGVMDLSSVWTPTLIHYTNYEYSEFKELIVRLANILVKSRSSTYQRVRKKYASSCHGKISLRANLNGPLIKMLTKTEM